MAKKLDLETITDRQHVPGVKSALAVLLCMSMKVAVCILSCICHFIVNICLSRHNTLLYCPV